MAIVKRGEIYWIRLWHNGKEIRESTKLRDRAAAQRKHDEFKAALWREKQTGKQYQFSDALAAWIEAADRSRSELSMVKEIARVYGDRPLTKVTPASITEAFKAKSPGNFNRLLNIIRAAINLAHAAEWIEAVPKFVRRKEPATDTRFITQQEWHKLRAELPDHLKIMADFAIATGLRWANVTGLEWRRVSIERAHAFVPATQAKGSKLISIPLSKAAISALKRAKGSTDGFGFVFKYRGEPIKSPKAAWLRARIRAGLPKFRWHDLRHTWASWHVQQGTPLAVLQKLGGWASIDMVMKYAGLGADHIAQFADNAAAVKPQRKAA